MDATAELNASLAGRYDVEREIGAGGMATVYLARDVRHDRRVALKVLHPDLAAALGAERFLAEIRTTAKLQHPHILPLHDSGEAGANLFYVMPYVEGETLRARLARETLLPIDDAIRIAREVLSALDYAHRQGIIHRDVKPENILLHDGSALVADFGIALAVSAAGNQRMTQTGLSLGTPQYMSPEQATGDKAIDGRADVYAMGAVLYEMLVGEPPFSGSSVQAIVAKLLTERPTPPTTVRDTIPEHIEAAVLKSLAKLPADRFSSASAFADALGTAGAQADGTVRKLARRGSSRMRASLAAAAAMGAIAGAAAVALARRPAPPAPVERYTLADAQVVNVGTGASMTYAGATVSISADGATVAWVQRDSAGVGIVVRELGQLAPKAVRGTDDASSVALSPNGASVAFVRDGALETTAVRAGAPIVLVPRNAACPFWGEDGWIYFSTRAAAGGAVGAFRVRPDGGRIDTLYFRQVAGRAEVIADPIPLPGGKSVLVRVARRPGVVPIGALDLASRTIKPLLDGSAARYLASGHLLYRNSNGTLMVTPIDLRKLEVGGPGVPAAATGADDAVSASQFTAAPNGTTVYVAGGGTNTELRWVSRDGTVLQRVDSTIRGVADFPALSPDGTRLAYRFEGSIWIRNLADGSKLRLTTQETSNYPAWTADGKSVSYFSRGASDPRSASRDSVLVLWLKRADGDGQAKMIARVDRSIAESAWSPDDSWVVFRTYSTERGAGDILGLRLGVDSVPVPLIATPAGEAEPTISPNGKWMSYISNQTGRDEVYVVPFPNTSSAVWPVSSSGGSEPRWSRDGRELYYRDARGNMMSVPISPAASFSFGTPKVLFSAAAYRAYTGHQQYDVSPDGKRFVMGVPTTGGQMPTLVLVKNWRAGLREH